MAFQAIKRLGPPGDTSVARSLEMIQRARTPLRIAIVLVVFVAILIPVFLGLHSLAMCGVLFAAALATCLRAIDMSPQLFRWAGHSACFMSLAYLTYAVFGLNVAPEVIVSFSTITLLTAAQFLGVRAAGFWGFASLALVAAASIMPPEVEREVPAAIRFVSRTAALLTILSFAIMFRNLQDQQSAKFEIQASTDPLTGLANRRELDRKLAEALLRSRRFDRQGALLFVDLDGVKHVNDSMGHAAGDELIQATAVRIAALTRSVDMPARVGGDEFVVLLSEFDDPKGGEIFARRLLAKLGETLYLGGRSIKPSASIGVAFFSGAGTDADDVLSAADDAMYEAKRAGGGRVFLRDGADLREIL